MGHFRCEILALAVALSGGWALAGASARADEAPRYPVDVCLSGPSLFTANEKSGSVSWLALASGSVLAERVVSATGRPSALDVFALPDGKQLVAVSLAFEDRLAFLAAAPASGDRPPALTLAEFASVGRAPAAVVFSVDGGEAFVACPGDNCIDVVDVSARRRVRTLPSVEGARRMALEGNVLTVAGRTEVAQHELPSGKMLWNAEPGVERPFNLSGLAVRDGRVYAAHQVRPTEMAVDPQMIVWGLIIANRLTVLEPYAAEAGDESYVTQNSVSLDVQRRAAGDPAAVCLMDRRSGLRAVVASAGTDRLLVFDPVPSYDYAGVKPARVADGKTDYNYAKQSDYTTGNRYEPLTEVRVGDRPVALALAEDGSKVYVACYLDDTIVEVSLEPQRERVLRKLPLGETPVVTEAHLGAREFFDADRSPGGWYSCHSCHPDGDSHGHTFDTTADGLGFAKRAPSLLDTEDTGPWSWLARFESLEAQIEASMFKTMAAKRRPSPERVSRLSAFVRSLDRPSARVFSTDETAAVERGAHLFERGECSRCHAGAAFTIEGTRDVGVHAELGVRRFNPPSLRGVGDRPRLLHDGRAASIESVFSEHNALGAHGRAAEFSDSELRDLVTFLRSL